MKLPAWFIVVLVIAAICSCGAVILLGPQIAAQFDTINNGWPANLTLTPYPTPLPDYNSPHGR